MKNAVELTKEVITKLGIECVDWEPNVLKLSIHEDLKFDESSMNKAMAGIAVMQRDAFWEDIASFHFITQAFNGDSPEHRSLQELTLSDMMIAVVCATKIRTELLDAGVGYVPVFTEEVSKFVATQALEGGVWYLPEPLLFAATYANRTMIVCNDCGNEEYLDDEDDTICVNCTSKYDPRVSLASNDHSAKRLAKGFGKNTKIVMKYPTSSVKESLARLSKGQKLEGDTPANVCAAKVFIALKLLKEDIKGVA